MCLSRCTIILCNYLSVLDRRVDDRFGSITGETLLHDGYCGRTSGGNLVHQSKHGQETGHF